MHEMGEHHAYVYPKGEKWEAERKMLAGYSQDQLVRALIAEIDVDRGDGLSNKDRDMAASKLFQALDLPPTLICQELDKPQSPQRKASLMSLLQNSKSAEVTQALLRQLSDRRPAVEPMGVWEIVKPRAFRVCDVAINTLAENLDARYPRGVKMYLGNKRRDEIIQATLAELKLATP